MATPAAQTRAPIHPHFDPQEMREAHAALSNADGMITAIAIGPEKISPAEWLPKIGFGIAGPNNLDRQLNLLAEHFMDRHDEILRLVRQAGNAYEPRLWRDKDGRIVADDWVDGFMDGVRLRSEPWQELFQQPDCALLSPILAHLRDKDGKYVLFDPMTGEGEKQLRLAVEALPEAVVALSRYWRRRRAFANGDMEAVSLFGKVGRNEPCPCGSGKKFKRCHGEAA
ncbi:UPF0149 family protein [Methylocystis bryophila]|uniref:YecA family protein n=1 Tax=Methylocystis bryophila TaxID=655015 RepID=A0A1W6MQV2_9HYPH|nr:UPF0149 family protein [Methylocystis bryophila]ARN79974.1 hypothetical protein B1812_01540 [Methylocystis bryophila]BDV39879.1 hypothetical protein DSM21852_31320 [Methylocystis bryophila]